jgi:PPK2 family polyphosphate:nucleotide phosphotransferase
MPPASPYLVPFEGPWSLSEAPTTPPPGAEGDKKQKKALGDAVEQLYELQRRLYAEDRRSLLLVFQAMDAAGKDSTIRHVLSGVNPAGFQVSSFKAPSKEELDHDFLWRTSRRLPERGRIGVFNRSYYEEVLVVRVHPEYLGGQRLPHTEQPRIWTERLSSIREHERHLAESGTTVLKFFLNISRDEQARRFLARIDEPRKNWKFNAGDLAERELWPAYMDAYQHALRATSRPWAPWYAIPADDKPFARRTVADLLVAALEDMAPSYPEASGDDLAGYRAALEAEL